MICSTLILIYLSLWTSLGQSVHRVHCYVLVKKLAHVGGFVKVTTRNAEHIFFLHLFYIWIFNSLLYLRAYRGPMKINFLKIILVCIHREAIQRNNFWWYIINNAHKERGTLENEILFVTVRVGYTELIMFYHPKGRYHMWIIKKSIFK